MITSPWQYIEKMHANLPVTSVLDAGTGVASLGWTRTFARQAWTAVTCSADRVGEIRRHFPAEAEATGRLVVGSWTDPRLLAGESYDVVLAHYLLGALERFTPYFEGRLFQRLRPLVRGRLYVVGLQPLDDPSSEEEEAVCELMHFRDACYLHRGGRAYREYPLEWVHQCLQAAGFRLVDSALFPNLYGGPYVQLLVDACQEEIDGLDCAELRAALGARLKRLHQRASALLESCGSLWWSHDYVVVAEPA